MKIEIHRNETSQPIKVEAINAYTKGGMYCIQFANGKVHKYPLCSIFRVTESYH